MKFKYKTELFDRFEDSEKTEKFLNEYGSNGYELKELLMLGYSVEGNIKGICIFVKEEK